MAAKKAPVKLTGYRFLEKDPSIDLFREAKRKSGMDFIDIALKGGMTEQTLRNWDFGKTRRPQHLTMRFAMSACGYEEQFVNGDTGHVLKSSYRKPSD